MIFFIFIFVRNSLKENSVLEEQNVSLRLINYPKYLKEDCKLSKRFFK